MTSNHHDIFIKFFYLQPHVFKDNEYEDAYDFLVGFYEILNLMNTVV